MMIFYAETVIDSSFFLSQFLGDKVKLDNFGIFKLVFSGKGRKEKSEVHARDIDDVHILFTPEAKLKRLIKKFSFVKKDL